MKRDLFKALLVIIVLSFSHLSYSADLDILVIGSSHSFSEGNESGVVQEKAFDPTVIASQLQNILADDPAITGTVNVVFDDIYKTKTILNVQTSSTGYNDITFNCYSLAQHYMWTEGRASRLANLRGENGTAWDYVVIMADPYIIANFPGMYTEGAIMLINEVKKGTAEPVLMAQWPENSSTFTTAKFNEIVYRVGDSVEVPVVSAGLGWSSLSPQDTSANHPTPDGAYLAAASIYSKLFDRNAKTSDYSYDDAIADHALTTVQASESATHYTGVFDTLNVFTMKYVKKRLVSFRETGTSTEDYLRDALYRLDDRCGIILTPTATNDPTDWDFNYGRGNDWWEDEKDYEVNPDKYDRAYGFPMHYYGMTNAINNMPYGIDKQFIGSYNDGTDLGIAYNMIRPGTRELSLPEDVRAIPIRLLYLKMREIVPAMNPLHDNTHMHFNLNDASVAFMYTLLSGRCPLVDEPTTQDYSESSDWMRWLGNKIGYETAWRMSHISSRVPGFQVLPSAATANEVTPGSSETLSVRFFYPPTSDVTVSVTANATSAAIVNPKTLTFNDTNYDTVQNVNVAGVPGASSSETFNVEYTTTSDDEVYSGLSDSWEYTNNRASTESLTVTDQTDRQEIAPKNGSKTIDLQVTGSLESNTALAMPFHGTLSWSGANVVYTPEADYLGSDSFAFAVNTGGTLTRGYIEITVEDVPEVKIVESGASTDVVEGGATDTYDVFLSEAPVASVTVTISTDSQVNVSPTSLTFTTGNWSTPQTVTVTAENDTVHELNHTGTVSHTTSSTDPNWDAISVNDVIATITDNDNQAPTVEAGPNQTLTLSAATSWTPADMTAVAWYDATDYSTITESSGAVSQWNDKSGNGNDITTTTSPTYRNSDSRLNNMPSIGYDQARKYLQTPSMTTRNLYVVTYYDDPDSKFDSWDILISSQDATPRFGGHSGQNYFQDNAINSAYLDGETSTNYAGGVTVLPMDASIWTVRWDADETGTWKILGGNASYNAWLHGAVGEVIFTDGTESLETTQKIEGYLAHKWGLEGNLPSGHPYKVDGPQAFGVTTDLDGTVGDDDGDSLTTTWSRTSGPVSAVLGDTAEVDTTATFTETGTYVFKLTADDTMDQTFDEVTITVNDPVTGYTVTYDGNGNTGGDVPTDQTKIVGEDLTLASNSGNLVKSGSTFAGWNTQADGLGTNYAEGATYSTDADLTLYAKWTTLPTYTVSYNGNSNDGGTAPSDQTKIQGIDLTLATNSGSLTKTGFTFAGWNTADDGTGTDYAEGGNYSTDADLTLYAKWTALATYTVTYNGNGSTGGNAPGDQTKTQGVDLTLATNSGSLVKTDYTFVGWNTATDGTGTDYAEGGTYTTEADLDLYAKWNALPTVSAGDDQTVTLGAGDPWSPADVSPVAWYDPSDQSTLSGSFLSGQLGVLDVTANGGINPATSEPWKAGDKYRLVFVCENGGGIDATATEIETYNSHIMNIAADSSLGDLTVGGTVQWKCLGSTAAVNVKTNTDIDVAVTDIPILKTTSAICATDYADLFDGNPTSRIDSNEDGNTVTTGWTADYSGWTATWTGTAADGTTSSPLGGATVRYGLARDATGMVFSRSTAANTGINSLYGISEPLEIVFSGASGAVTQLWDKSGNGNHASQTNASSQPTYRSSDSRLNNMPTIGYDQAKKYLTIPSMTIQNVYMVTYYDDPDDTFDSFRLLFGNGNTNSQVAQGTADRWEGKGIFADENFYKNGETTAVGTNAILPMPATVWKFKGDAQTTDIWWLLGGLQSYHYWEYGAIGEVIFTDGTETLETQQKIEGYLAHKWGTAASLPADHPYKDASPGGGTAIVTLDGTVNDTDDTPTHTWSDTGTGTGTGSVTFADETALDSTVTFNDTGTYILRLTADDGNAQVTDDVTITVNPEGALSVTYDGNTSDGGSVPVDGTVYVADDTVTVLGNTGNLVLTGYTFAGWNTQADGLGTGYAADATFTITTNTTLYAKWTLNQYTITFDSAGGTDVDPITQDYGSDVTAPEDPTKTGYTFTGWSPAVPANMPASNTTCVAQWEINQYTISFDSAGGTDVDPITQDYNTAVTAPADPTKTGYTFTGWSPTVPATMPATNTTCVAQWAHDGTPHSADENSDWSISQSEVESFITAYNSNNNTVTTTNGDITSGRITMREVMRAIYLYNDGGAYIYTGSATDGYEIEVPAAPAPPAPETAATTETGTGDKGDGSIVVSTTADSGVGSLRDAIAIASDGETITIDDSVDTITLLSEIVIDKSITIDGQGVAIVSGEAQTRIFKVENAVEAIDVKIRNIGIVDAKNATDEFGGAVYNNGQTLTLDTVLFDGNANTSENGKGGAVYSSGALNAENSIFTNNSASEENDLYSE